LFKKLDLYFHTLRHLRPVQIYGRLWFKLKRVSPNVSPAPPRRQTSTHWIPVAKREPSLLSQREFLFLNQRGSLDEIGWDSDAREKLWRYNQHYFDDLNARDAHDRAQWHTALIEEWIAQNPPGAWVGWEPYPTSLRIVNWIKWSLGGGQLTDAAIHSVAIQVRWLSQKLEFHLLGNHLFSNAKALVFAGCFFDGAEADGWLKTGAEILAREIPEQILADGGQFERSTMYHALALEDVLDLCNVLRCYESAITDETQLLSEIQSLRKLCEARVPDMISWLKAMQHPDGEVSFFNDAAFGVSPSFDELESYASRMGFPVGSTARPVAHLKQSGYCRIQTENAVAIIDFAPVGPDYLPGHAHADTLSFEFSVLGQRVFVNSGTSCYGVSAQRLRQRGTAAHNTVVLNDQNSSEVWGGFRVARRARVHHVRIEHKEHDATIAYGEHDGYTRLPGKPVHARQFLMQGRSLLVSDEIKAQEGAVFNGKAFARFHLHPDLRVVVSSEDSKIGTIHLPDGQQLSWNAPLATRVRIEPSTWHPRFGESVTNQCLVLELLSGKSELQLNW
jgi:uncharacterized heparinase superfamily protein